MNLSFFYYSMGAGGAERSIALLSGYAARLGDSVSILTMEESPSFYPLDPRVKLVCLKTARESGSILESISNNLRRASCLRKALEELRPDVIICFAPNTELLSSLARSGLNIALVGSERANPLHERRSFLRTFGRQISKRCDGFIFQTERAKKLYPKRTQEKSVVLHNAIEKAPFLEQKAWSGMRQGIIAVGRLESQKCFSDLIRAFAIVHERHPAAYLDIFGEGSERGNLEEQIALLDLGDVVHLRGKTADIFEQYARHAVFAMSSIFEGFPNALMEAMGSGCACISTNCDFGPAEMIRDGENGFLVPVHDADAMADKLCWLLEHQEDAKRIGEQAREILENHDIEVVGAQFREYLEQVCGGSRKARNAR